MAHYFLDFEKPIEKLEELGANKNELIIALGPSISSTHYEVNADLVGPIYESICNKNEDIIFGIKEKLTFLKEDINIKKFN